jgi:RNA polymerase sigma-70 factor (ECF subfamily)
VAEPRAAREARFTSIFEATYASVLRYARRRSASDADAQEAVAEAFLVAWRRLDDLPQESAVLPWLYGVTRRVMANRRRGEARRSRLIDRLGSVLSSARFEPASMEVDPVLEALARLSATDQELLRLVAWEGLSNPEVAAALDCSVANVSVRLHRARRRLGRELDRGALQEERAPGHMS